VYTGLEKDAPLSVGNGAFCFTADFTGLQTFFDEYAAAGDAFPLCTMAEWGWHSYAGSPPDDSMLRLTPYDTWGRQVGYAVDDQGQEDLFRALRQNAHKFHLGKIGFELDGKPPALENAKPLRQTLDLWEGILSSEFVLSGERILAETFVHPARDTLYVRVSSSLLRDGKLKVILSFPYGSHKKSAADFEHPDLHTTTAAGKTDQGIILERTMDGTRYRVTAVCPGVTVDSPGPHTFAFSVSDGTMELAFHFEPLCVESMGINALPAPAACPPSFAAARSACVDFWQDYWTRGGAIDFSGSGDCRGDELERRVVLSQYLMAIQSRGSLPPAETGLTCNSWYGKFHLEMHYWHQAHFALWGRTEELKKSLGFYKRILPLARELACSQGYRGARWPKMCDAGGRNTPSSIAVLLIWQQVHPLMLAELCYRSAPDASFLREYRDVVAETAEFMRSFVHWDGESSRFVLGPPYIPAQERHDPRIVLNAPYELEYFRWGFREADLWLGRLGEAPRFSDAAEKLAVPVVKDGLYLAHENCPDTFTRRPFFTDHPSMLAMYGVLNSERIDPKTMSATLDKILEVWDMDSLWGWDFPMMAMTACRLGRYDNAIDLLLMDSPKNTYMPNGHNRQQGSGDLPLYLPGNGGLLIASAMMAAGYGVPGGAGSGSLFPQGFAVKAEGLHAYI
jgi:hypothetical protein